MKFADICGQEDIKKHLQNAILMGKVSHAYIISGEKESGKMMLAEAFAQTLLCDERVKKKTSGQDACEECHSCKQARNHNHPDIRYVTHEKPSTISVEDIRQQINNDIVIKPYASPYKIYIVDEAEKMNKAAQNALLKTMEEPPEYAVLFLLTTNASGFLQTIQSRCVTLELKPVAKNIIIRELMEKQRIPDYQAEICAAFAQGNYGKAIKLASSDTFNEMKSHMVNILRRMDNMELFEISQTVKELEEYKGVIRDYLDLMTMWFRDVLLYKATGDANSITFQDETIIIKKQANVAKFAGLEKILESLSDTKRKMAANVNYNLCMELLLLTIKENIS